MDRITSQDGSSTVLGDWLDAPHFFLLEILILIRISISGSTIYGSATPDMNIKEGLVKLELLPVHVLALWIQKH